MRTKVTTIGFDADDTLWQNEQFFRLTQERFAELLSDFVDPDHLAARLVAAERRNLGRYGFGIKGFTLSMIEAAIEVSDAKVPASVIAELIDAGQEMLAHPIELLPHVEDVITELSRDHAILLITKGDLLDQERKLAQSGLGEMFEAVEIVSDKVPGVYTRAFAPFGGTSTAMMVGNSVKSDVIPALEAGAWGIHVPHDLTWEYELADEPAAHARFRQIEDLGQLPKLIRELV
ncbi:HAD family hydrolase [Aliiroseovarius sp. KMU-50]|uniref:HAD family hydrolase n=1 Tax=Aliiroseovarius salicola TaxID=3009082 RepID=A0ABT4VWM5_9RHOB|nr:HAD family hydrolase [Aliiroseovarius sp. KMU-50]MDA5092584.1 HAD family hydrolase [Aliiroseovarius sp. KMU-50]